MGTAPCRVSAFGKDGQRLTVSRGGELVVAVFAGNYNTPDAWKVPVSVIVDHVVPAL